MAVNNVVLVGRLTNDVKINMIGDNVKQAKFTIAVDRRYKRKNVERPDTDFIKVNATRSAAEFAEKYFTKGKQVSIVGSIETYSYQQEERTVYDFCVKADQLGFADSRSGNSEKSGNSVGGAEIGSANALDFLDESEFAPADSFDSDDLPF